MSKHRIAAITLACAAASAAAPAAFAQDLEGDYSRAFHLIEDLQPSAALPFLRRAAEYGHLAAQRTLGLILLYGEGLYGKEVVSEPTEGLLWMRRAAAQGDAAAKLVVNHIETSRATSPERED